MRIVLVGRADDRRRLQAALAGMPLEIVGESDTLAAAHKAATTVDAFLVSPHQGDGTADDPLVEPLTPRELEVLELLAEGLPNKAIAVRLRISDQTVKFHVAAICGKLGAANRTDAVRLALRRGLVTV